MKKFFIIIPLIAGLLIFYSANAQTPPLAVLTWKALTYVPPEYAGKALPVPGSTVLASVELISSGSPVDLSKSQIHWYMDDRLMQSGMGVRTFEFKIPETKKGKVWLKVNISDRNIYETEEIPLAQPKIKFSTSGLFDGVSLGKKIILKAYPYYFNIESLSQLDFGWEINGESPDDSDNPDVLTLSVPENIGSLDISARLKIQSLIVPSESAARSEEFKISP